MNIVCVKQDAIAAESLELLEDADHLQMPTEQQFDVRESELQRLLVLLPETSCVKAQADALRAHAQALEAIAKQRGQRGREPLTRRLRARVHRTPEAARRPPIDPHTIRMYKFHIGTSVRGPKPPKTYLAHPRAA